MRAGIALTSMVLLSACGSGSKGVASTPSLESIRPVNYSTILPSNAPKIGALYFSGTGRRPKFALPDGTIFNELCYDDYTKTAALAELSGQIVDDGIRIDSKTIKSELNGNASFSSPKIAQLASLTLGGRVGRDNVLQLTNVREISLTDEGAGIIRDNLGDKCRATIAQMKKEHRQVVLLLSAWRADKVTDTATSDEDFEGGVAIGSNIKAGNSSVTTSGPAIGGRFSRKAFDATTYSLVYLFINPDTESM